MVNATDYNSYMKSLPLHGTRYRYVKYKCRCDPCKDANAKYKRNKIARNRDDKASETLSIEQACIAESNERLTCGLPGTYEWHGCRGESCKESIRERAKDRRFLEALKVS
jgi:hypothetical protein